MQPGNDPRNRLYQNGEEVLISGLYQCVACGNQLTFIAGDRFTECNVCFAGSEDGPAGFDTEEVDLWRLISEA